MLIPRQSRTQMSQEGQKPFERCDPGAVCSAENVAGSLWNITYYRNGTRLKGFLGMEL